MIGWVCWGGIYGVPEVKKIESVCRILTLALPVSGKNQGERFPGIGMKTVISRR